VEPIAHIQFADGPLRPVYEAAGRQFVVTDEGGAGQRCVIHPAGRVPADVCQSGGLLTYWPPETRIFRRAPRAA